MSGKEKVYVTASFVMGLATGFTFISAITDQHTSALIWLCIGLFAVWLRSHLIMLIVFENLKEYLDQWRKLQ